MPKSFLDIPQKKLFVFTIIAGSLTALFAMLVTFSNTLQLLDQGFEQFLAAIRTPGWNGFFLAITYFGSIQFVSIATVFLGISFLLRKDLAHFAIFLGTIIGSSASVFILKDFIERARPLLGVYTETSYSFPSGHTSISVVFYGLLAYLAGKKAKTNRARTNIFFGWIFVMLMVGFSRLYLGVHFASDVLAGYAVGSFWLCVGIYFFEELFSKTKKRS